MPPVSERQRRAMEAAAHGRSTLGIPQSVGREFVDALCAVADRLAGKGQIHADGGDEPGNGREPYGDTDYADPGYQPDRKKRYPINTPERIRSAWDYVHKAKDADRYTPEQRRLIEGRIVAAWKRKIDPAGPPEAR